MEYTIPLLLELGSISVMLANERNVDVVVAELVDYANEVDLEFACKAVSSIGSIPRMVYRDNFNPVWS